MYLQCYLPALGQKNKLLEKQPNNDPAPREQTVSRDSIGNSLNLMGSRVGLVESQTMSVKDKNSDDEAEESE